MSRTRWANHKSRWQHFGVLRVKRQNATLNRWPGASMCRGGSVLTLHQSHDMETDSQRNTCDGSSGQPGTLLQISYFTANMQYTIFYNIILGLGKMTNCQDRFPAIQFVTAPCSSVNAYFATVIWFILTCGRNNSDEAHIVPDEDGWRCWCRLFKYCNLICGVCKEG
jgi:hypothetical protein